MLAALTSFNDSRIVVQTSAATSLVRGLSVPVLVTQSGVSGSASYRSQGDQTAIGFSCPIFAFAELLRLLCL